MNPGKRWRAVGLICVALIVTLGGCARHKPPRERPPYDGIPTLETATPATAPSPEWTPTPGEQLAITPTPLAPSPATPVATLPPVEPQPSIPTATLSPTIAPPDNPVGETTYIVQPGDTILSIADKFGVAAADLMFRNGLTDPNALAVGQELIIPSASAAPSEEAVKTIQHLVTRGETLYRIAKLYNTTPEEILAWNPSLKGPEQLISGSFLIVPVGAMGRARTHMVRYGENLSSIAARYGVTVGALLQANGLANANVIYAGQLLLIPE